jgi:competence ComEA-like helix-hairpin-helix protein
MKGKFLKEYFNFSTRERNGLVVLLVILFGVVTVNFIVSKQNDSSKVNFENFENEIDEFVTYQTPDFENSELFYFDPNTATKEQLLQLGLSPKTVNGISNYIAKGRKFYAPEDLMKVYGITTEEFDLVKDYIVIEKPSYKTNFYSNNKNKSQQTAVLSMFDPNTATKEEFVKLGLKPWQADNIIKSRNKGFVYKSVDDFSKVYGLDKEMIETLKPYIQIVDTFSTVSNNSGKSDKLLSLQINQATETELQQIRGIGPSYAKRIIEYRTKLGGFVKIDQLLEVYGFTPELYESIKGNFIVDSENIKKININKATFKELVTQPYINKENAIIILNYREFAGKIKTFDELLKQKAITNDFYLKLSPYITTE